MAQVITIDSNVTGLRIAEEESLGTLPVTPVWDPYEPNSYADFGGSIETVARNPINADRQRAKGTTTDLDASGGFNTDMTATNLKNILQGFLAADRRVKDELASTDVTGANTFQVAAGGTAYLTGDLLFASGFDDDANNGPHVVVSSTATTVVVSSVLVNAAAQNGLLERVGHQFTSGDAQIDISGTLPALDSTVKDMTAFGLIPGEWVFIGGDLSGEQFANAENNGFARVRSVIANTIEFDKTSDTMLVDTGVGKTIRVFFGSIIRNELAALIVKRSYQLERTLGAPDDSFPGQIQSEYIVGAVPSEFSLNISGQSKLEADLTFVGIDVEQRDGVTGVKTGDRPALSSEEAFNTSSDFSRINLSKVVPGDASPPALFAFATEITLNVNNNVEPNKAVAVLGAIGVSLGTFEVSADVTAYFNDVAGTAAVRDNDDITLDAHVVSKNRGFSFDMPLCSLGDGRPEVEQDAAITVPLELQAARGAPVHPDLDYTLLFMFWSYLPTIAG